MALVTVVRAHRQIGGEYSVMLGFRFVQRAVSVPLICSTTSTLEAEQVKYLLHGDLVAQPVEVDTRHGWPFLVEKKETVPFPLYI